ncbi:Uncharacterised protein [Mycobacteroides abscessus subsp. abscessus]|nr:Uncharacterised protein [Mycobacteroides abscessus subsp. abscessus]
MTIDAVSINQPADHPTSCVPNRFAQLYTEPATGYFAASSMKHSATQSCPTKTIGHDHR